MLTNLCKGSLNELELNQRRKQSIGLLILFPFTGFNVSCTVSYVYYPNYVFSSFCQLLFFLWNVFLNKNGKSYFLNYRGFILSAFNSTFIWAVFKIFNSTIFLTYWIISNLECYFHEDIPQQISDTSHIKTVQKLKSNFPVFYILL